MSTVDTTSSASTRLPTTAGDVMTTEVVSVRAETPVRDIARLLLANHISAVPVLDGSGAPIGMVSEGDLIERVEAERRERSDWWLAMLAEGESMSPEYLSRACRPERTARDVMSRPVVTVGEETGTAEIARLLQTYRIKRVPVVRDGAVVGIVSRENLLRALAQESPSDSSKPKLPGFLAGMLADIDRRIDHSRRGPGPHLGPKARSDDTRVSVGDFCRLAADYESRELQHSEELRRIAAKERQQTVAQLIDRHITDEAWRNRVHQARMAAEHGEREFMLLRFPSGLCSDGGRAINMSEPDWPASLRGEAAELYLRWERDLKPQGFHLTARVLDFPSGMPGDVGLFLGWRQ
jgi:CBS domain-containing protein